MRARKMSLKRSRIGSWIPRSTSSLMSSFMSIAPPASLCGVTDEIAHVVDIEVAREAPARDVVRIVLASAAVHRRSGSWARRALARAMFVLPDTQDRRAMQCGIGARAILGQCAVPGRFSVLLAPDARRRMRPLGRSRVLRRPRSARRGNSCDDIRHRCISPEQIVACVGVRRGQAGRGDLVHGRSTRPRCSASRSCAATACAPAPSSATAPTSAARTCLDVGFYGSEGLACSQFCTFTDTSRCTGGTCGDGVINGDEVCGTRRPPAG